MSDKIDVPKAELVWLENSNNQSEDNDEIQQQLRRVNSNFKILKSKDQWDEYLRCQPVDAAITLIVNDKLGQQLVPDIHQLPQILSIYIYCMHKPLHDQWAANCKEKVKGVFTEFDKLLSALVPIHIVQHQSIMYSEPTPLDSPDASPVTQAPLLYALDTTYLISDGCFDYIRRMKTEVEEKDDFVSFCQEALQGSENQALLDIIAQFKDKYSANEAVLWLNRNDFFHKFIDNTFLYAFIEAMLPCRILIRDVQKQLAQDQWPSKIQVYRCVILSDEQFQHLKSFNGKTIAMKSFLLANFNRDHILAYISEYKLTNEEKRILFTIEADPQTKDTKPFAKIRSIDLNDVLFMIGSLFKVTEIEDEQDGLINIKLTLCANDDTSESKELVEQLKLNFIDQNGETDMIGFGQFLCSLGSSFRACNLWDDGKKILHACLKKLSDNDPNRLRCYDMLGWIELQEENFDSSHDWYKKSLEMRKEKLHLDDSYLTDNYKNLAEISLRTGDYTQALTYFKELCTILKKAPAADCCDLLYCYVNIATIYEKLENFTQAMQFYYLALTILIEYNYSDENIYAAVYTNLGKIRGTLKQYPLALGYYQMSLEIKLKMNLTATTSLAKTYESIGSTYEFMNDVQQARTNYDKAMEIYRQVCSSEDSIVRELEEHIRNLSVDNPN